MRAGEPQGRCEGSHRSLTAGSWLPAHYGITGQAPAATRAERKPTWTRTAIPAEGRCHCRDSPNQLRPKAGCRSRDPARQFRQTGRRKPAPRASAASGGCRTGRRPRLSSAPGPPPWPWPTTPSPSRPRRPRSASTTTGVGTTAVTNGTSGPQVSHSVATTSASGVTVTTTSHVVNGKTVVTHVRHVPAYHDN